MLKLATEAILADAAFSPSADSRIIISFSCCTRCACTWLGSASSCRDAIAVLALASSFWLSGYHKS